MERTERQIHAAARELQRKLEAHWTPKSILSMETTVAPDLSKIIVRALDPDGDELHRAELDPNAGAWDLYRDGKLAAAHGMLESSRRFQAAAREHAERVAAD